VTASNFSLDESVAGAPLGRWIYFLSAGAVERVSVKGGDAERVAELRDWPIAGWWGWMGLDPEDAPMVLHDIGSQDIYALTLSQE
jgi:hypothetical protein